MLACARFAVTVVLALLSANLALAQSDPGAPPTPQVRSVNGVDYINGGAGDEARAAIAQVQPGFGLRLLFSNGGGEFLVADHVAVKGKAGEVFDVDRAGPLLLVRLPPGDYSVAATYEGRTEIRPVKVGAATSTLNWSFGGARR
jgi:hypothetical protein